MKRKWHVQCITGGFSVVNAWLVLGDICTGKEIADNFICFMSTSFESIKLCLYISNP